MLLSRQRLPRGLSAGYPKWTSFFGLADDSSTIPPPGPAHQHPATLRHVHALGQTAPWGPPCIGPGPRSWILGDAGGFGD